jgi:hypothetical protein
MRFVFWQGCISIHQNALLNALAKRHTVTLVVEQKIHQERISEGWEIPELKHISIITAPDKQEILKLIKREKNAEHIVSGLDTVFKSYHLISLLNCYGIKPHIYAEPYNPSGFLGFIRFVKYRLLALKYRNRIGAFLATGKLGVYCYKKAGFSTKRLFEWGYFTDIQAVISSSEQKSSTLPRLIYIGKLDKRKNVHTLLEICSKQVKNYMVLSVIGCGPEESFLKTISNQAKIKFYGTVPHKDIYKHLLSSDILILPSLFDGWGAVVNEALQCGCRAITSDHCGAASLINSLSKGSVFPLKKGSLSLESAILTEINKGILSPAKRNSLIEWAQKTISGEAAANYLEEIITTYNNKNSAMQIIPPWDK